MMPNRALHIYLKPGNTAGKPISVGFFLLLCLVIFIITGPVSGMIDVKHGDSAPSIVLKDGNGREYGLDEFRGKALVILFGQSNHLKTSRACDALREVFSESELRCQPIQWLFVLSRSSRLEDLHLKLNEYRIPPLVVHDTGRKAFGDYGVVVLPSLVVIDPEGKVVHAQAGMHHRFSDLAYHAIRVAIGCLTYDEFTVMRLAHPEQSPTADTIRSQRLIHLAEQLATHEMNVMAIAKYREALELNPESFAAHLGLGDVLLSDNKHELAEAEFRQARTLQPDSVEAALGHATALANGDADDLAASLVIAGELRKKNPDSARVHFVLGLIEEQRGDITAASIHYRTATEILLREMKQSR